MSFDLIRYATEALDRVVTMASMVGKAIARALEALRLQNVGLADEVQRSDNAINRLQQAGEKARSP